MCPHDIICAIELQYYPYICDTTIQVFEYRPKYLKQYSTPIIMSFICDSILNILEVGEYPHLNNNLKDVTNYIIKTHLFHKL